MTCLNAPTRLGGVSHSHSPNLPPRRLPVGRQAAGDRRRTVVALPKAALEVDGPAEPQALDAGGWLQVCDHVPGGSPLTVRTSGEGTCDGVSPIQASNSLLERSEHLSKSIHPHGQGACEAEERMEECSPGPSCGDSVVARQSFARHYLESLYRNGGALRGLALPMAVQVAGPEVREEDEAVEKMVVKGPAPPGNGGGPDRDFYANVGDALLRLRSEIPLLFDKDLTYDIYRDDITFRDPRNGFHGLRNYKIIFWSLRLHGKIFFSKIFVEVKSLCQVSDKEIRMRWCVHGVPRIPWEAQGIFDGVSIYRLDSHGKIYEHEVTNVIFRDPPALRFPMFANLLPAQRVQRQPCPGAWYIKGMQSFLFLVQRFSWVRMYMVMLMSLQLLADSGLATTNS